VLCVEMTGLGMRSVTKLCLSVAPNLRRGYHILFQGWSKW